MTAPAFVDPALGEHICLPVASDTEKLDFMAEFVANGVRRGNKVMILTNTTSPDEVRERLGLLAEYGVDVIDGRDILLQGGSFDPERVLQGFLFGVQRAEAEGYHGLWVAGDMTCASDKVPGIERLFDFEADSNAAFMEGKLTAVCMYDRRWFDSDALDRAAAAHPLTPKQAELRFSRTNEPAGIRLVGEIDGTNLVAFHQIIRPLALVEDDLTIDASALGFADAAAIRLLAATAGTRTGRTTIVGTTALCRLLRLAELDRQSDVELREVAWHNVSRGQMAALPYTTAFTRFRLSEVRQAASAHARTAGLTGSSLEDFVFAVNELTTNAVRHGGGGGQLRMWTGDDYLYAEVSDKGQGIPPEYASKQSPDPRHLGLWFAQTLAEDLHIDTSPDGTTIWLSVPGAL